ncbi:MAG TPA: DUF2249 domain-containing protein [Gemmatimonadaceae bacterium]|nr:DUF2249 domain-containing protein [Gemmatimonadaceae bacterium]
MSDVLARDESLVEVFVRHAPHFAKLRNRAMRRVMARLVTVEQAARTAGVPVAELLADLNTALGVFPEPAPPEGDRPADARDGAVPAPAPAVEDARAHPTHAPVVEVDVREDLRAGREPFSKIMSAVGALRGDEVLHLRAIFEPAPLFAVLAKRGFVHESLRHADDDWSVWFWRPDAESAAGTVPSPCDAAAPGCAPAAGDDASSPHVVWLDVRGLEPPEPLVCTLAALETLPDGYALVQVNVRVPQFLLPVLAERGFSCAIDESLADRVLVRIWRAT